MLSCTFCQMLELRILTQLVNSTTQRWKDGTIFDPKKTDNYKLRFDDQPQKMVGSWLA